MPGADLQIPTGDGVVVYYPQLVSYDHTKETYIIDSGSSVTITSITGSGYVSIIYYGDGDGNFTLRINIDGNYEDEIPTNEKRIGVYTFNNVLSIELYNPATVTGTYSSMSLSVRGFRYV